MASDDKKERWRLLELLNWSSEYLINHGFENARLNAELLLAHILNFKRFELYLNFDRPLSLKELADFKSVLKRRLAHEPLQYITGRTEFFSLPFITRPGVLIPRPETEILVEQALKTCQEDFKSHESIQVLDIGTGSGNIAIGVAKHVDRAMVTAVDISAEALQIAQENAELNQVSDRIQFLKIDDLASLSRKSQRAFHLVLSNPPYISRSEFINLPQEISRYEPAIALMGGADGLEFFRMIAPLLRDLLHSQGGHVLFEIGATQSKMVRQIFLDAKFEDMVVHSDLAGRPRVIHLNAAHHV